MKSRLLLSAIAFPMFALSQGHGQSSPAANQQRIETRIMTLGAIGDTAAGILKRVAYSKGDIAARKYIVSLMQSAGLTVRVDAGGEYHRLAERQ